MKNVNSKNELLKLNLEKNNENKVLIIAGSKTN